MGNFDCTQHKEFKAEFAESKYPDAFASQPDIDFVKKWGEEHNYRLRANAKAAPENVADPPFSFSPWETYMYEQYDKNMGIIIRLARQNKNKLRNLGDVEVCVVPPDLLARANGDEKPPWEEQNSATYWAKLATDFRTDFRLGERRAENGKSVTRWTGRGRQTEFKIT
ncbi:unnamed protein product, partial [Amoebophrya sp. A25]|eukprot:GSA25T00002604001.1